MKKNRWMYLLAGLLIVMAIVLICIPYIKNLQESDKAFAIKNIEKVNRILLINNSGDTADLTLDKNAWHVNHKFKVKAFAIKNLLETIQYVKVDYPVSKAGHNNVLKDLMQNNTRVAIFTGDSEPEKVYYVGGPNVTNTGTFMIMELAGEMAKRPYVTSIIGGAGYLTGNYTAKADDWRSNQIFSYPSKDIKSIKIEYPLKPDGSFEIDNTNPTKPTITPLLSTSATTIPADNKRLIEYINYFNEGYAENYISYYQNIDTILMTTAYCNITIVGNKGDKNLLRIYHKPISERSKQQFDEQGNPMEYDMDKFIGAINNDKEFVLIQFYSFGKFFKQYMQFFGQATSVSKKSK